MGKFIGIYICPAKTNKSEISSLVLQAKIACMESHHDKAALCRPIPNHLKRRLQYSMIPCTRPDRALGWDFYVSADHPV